MGNLVPGDQYIAQDFFRKLPQHLKNIANLYIHVGGYQLNIPDWLMHACMLIIMVCSFRNLTTMCTCQQKSASQCEECICCFQIVFGDFIQLYTNAGAV